MSESPAIRLSKVMNDITVAEKRLDKWVYGTGVREPKISDAHAALVKARVLIREVLAGMAVQELMDRDEANT